MYAEHPSIHHCAQTQVIKHVTAISPNIARAIFPLTFVVKAVDLSDLPRFMVAPDKGDPVRIADFDNKEEEEGFDRIETSIYEVAYAVTSSSQSGW